MEKKFNILFTLTEKKAVRTNWAEHCDGTVSKDGHPIYAKTCLYCYFIFLEGEKEKNGVAGYWGWLHL